MSNSVAFYKATVSGLTLVAGSISEDKGEASLLIYVGEKKPFCHNFIWMERAEVARYIWRDICIICCQGLEECEARQEED